MAQPSTQIVASWSKLALRDTTWELLNVVLERALTTKWTGKSEAERGDFIERYMPQIAEHLRDEASVARTDAAFCPYEIDDEDIPYIRLVERAPSKLLAKLRRVDPFEFERVCAKLLERLGGKSRVTKKTGDGGIDFITVELDILPASIPLPAQCKAAVIGQAKRYTSKPIAERALREFVGASLVERNELRAERNILPLSPVLLAFWTTADFDQSCKVFARKAGVWLMDGDTLAAHLAELDLTDWVMTLADEKQAHAFAGDASEDNA